MTELEHIISLAIIGQYTDQDHSNNLINLFLLQQKKEPTISEQQAHEIFPVLFSTFFIAFIGHFLTHFPHSMHKL